MKYCPLISYGKEYSREVDCMGEGCMFWDKEADNCAIVVALKSSYAPFTTQMLINECIGRPEPDPRSTGYPYNQNY